MEIIIHLKTTSFLLLPFISLFSLFKALANERDRIGAREREGQIRSQAREAELQLQEEERERESIFNYLFQADLSHN